MRTLAYLTILAVFVLLVTSADAINYQHSFYSQGGQVTLDIDSTKLLVQLDTTLSAPAADSVLMSYNAIQQVLRSERTIRQFVACSLSIPIGQGAWLDSLRADPSVRLVEPYYRVASGDAAYFSDRICVAFADGTTRQFVDSVNSIMHVQLERELRGMPNVFLLLNTPGSGKGVVELASAYFQLPGVRYAYPTTGIRPQASGYKIYDYYSDKQQHLSRIIGTLNYASVWDFAGVAGSRLVAVVDDGVTSHEDLPSSRVVGGYDFAYNDYNPAPFDTFSHGESCAGLIAASHTTDSISGQSSLSGMFSVAPAARIMPLRVVYNDGYYLTLEELAEAVTFAYLSGADVISCSWGICAEVIGYDALPDAMARAYRDGRSGKGTAVVFAAGNCGNGFVAWPGKDYRAIAVGAVNLNDQLWTWSGSGAELDLVAPSADVCYQGDVFTLDLMGNSGVNPQMTISPCGNTVNWGCGRLPHNDVDYDCHFGGTSAAAPVVAGVASLLIARDTMLTSEEVYDILRKSAVPLGGTVPNNTFGYGRVDAFRAVLSIARGDVDNDAVIDISDLVALVEYLMIEPYPAPFPAPKLGDCNCDGLVDASDIAYLIDYVILGTGPAPVKPCYKF